jgi:hypothetical protein
MSCIVRILAWKSKVLADGTINLDLKLFIDLSFLVFSVNVESTNVNQNNE